MDVESNASNDIIMSFVSSQQNSLYSYLLVVYMLIYAYMRDWYILFCDKTRVHILYFSGNL